MRINPQVTANQSIIVTQAEEPLDTAINTALQNQQLIVTDNVVNVALQNLLKELAVMIGQRQTLLDSLPADIKQLVQNSLDTSNEQTIAQGFTAVLKSQRTSIDKVLILANVIENAAQITNTQQPVLENLPAEIKQMLANIKTFVPTQSELVALANEMRTAAHTEMPVKDMNLIAQSAMFANRAIAIATTADSPQGLLKNLMSIIAESNTPQLPTALLEGESAVSSMPSKCLTNGQTPTFLEEGMPVAKALRNNLAIALPQEQQNLSTSMPQQPNLLLEITPETVTNLQEVVTLIHTPGEALLKDVSPEFRQQLNAVVAMLQEQVDSLAGEKTIQAQYIQQYSDTNIPDDTNFVVQNLNQLVDMAEEDRTGLRQIMNAAIAFAPSFIQQGAADGFQMPDIWALLTLSHAISAENKKDLEKSSSTLKELAASLQKGIQTSSTNTSEHVSTAVSIPLCFVDGAPPYPLYMHVYHQRKNSGGSSDENRNYETWVRFCLVTQNMGNVECVFRLYEQNLLDVRVNIEDKDGAMLFKQDLIELRKKFEQWPLKLTGITVS